MNESIPSQFQRLTSDDTRKAFYAGLKGPAWWLGGAKRGRVALYIG